MLLVIEVKDVFPKFFPVYILNLAGYNAHLFIKELGCDEENIYVIPNNEQKYIPYNNQVHNGFKLTFIYTFKFMVNVYTLSNNLVAEQFSETFSKRFF